MIYPSADELERKVGSKYSLVIAVAKRAKQLREGAPKLVESKSSNPITIALEEIAAGKIELRAPSPEELEAAKTREIEAPVEKAKPPAVSELLKIPTEQSDKETSKTGSSEGEETKVPETASAESAKETGNTSEKEKTEK